MESPRFPDIKGYTPICLCGQGAYGQVWLVEDITGRRLALKVVYKSILGGEWEREYNGLVTFQRKVKKHRNLIEIYHIEDRDSFFYYTMECADNMSFEEDNSYVPSTMENMIKHFGKIGPESLVEISSELLCGIGHLHDSGIVHRDIKPGNIIFVNRVPKLGDIGLVSSINQTLSMAGTHWFFPPEMLMSGKYYDKEINSSQLDTYALGKTIYCGLTGNSPEKFPSISSLLLSDKKSKKLNKIIKLACNRNIVFRFKNAFDFYKAINNESVLLNSSKYFLSFFSGAFYSVSNACISAYASLGAWKYLIFIILIGLILFGAPHVYKHYLYAQSLAPDANPEDIQKYKVLCENDYKKAVPAIKEKIERKFRATLGTEATKGGFQKIDVFNNNFDDPKLWQKKGDLNSVNSNNITLTGTKSLEMLLSGYRLPDSYEISFDICLAAFKGSFEFEVGKQNFQKVSCPKAFKWGINSKSKFDDLSFRYLPGKYCSYIKSLTAQIPYVPLRQFYNIKVICFNNSIRIYSNGNLVYSPSPMLFAGGFLKLIVKSNKGYSRLILKNFHIYDLTKQRDKSKITKFTEIDYTDGRRTRRVIDKNIMFDYPKPKPVVNPKKPFQISWFPVEKTGEKDLGDWRYFAGRDWYPLRDGKGRRTKRMGTTYTKVLPNDFSLIFYVGKKNNCEFRIIDKKVSDLRALRYKAVLNAYPYVSIVVEGDILKLYYSPCAGEKVVLARKNIDEEEYLVKLVCIKGNISIYKMKEKRTKSGTFYYRDYYNEGLLIENLSKLQFNNAFVIMLGRGSDIWADRLNPQIIPVWENVEKEIDDTLQYIDTHWYEGRTSDKILKMKRAAFYLSQKTGYPEKYLLAALKEKYSQKASKDLKKKIANIKTE